MERSGDLPKARELFLRISAVDPDAYDVAARLESLGPPTRARRTPNRPGTAADGPQGRTAEGVARRPLGSGP